MKIVERVSDGGASESSIQELEKTLGASLPEAYRTFLKEENGGIPEPAGFEFIESGKPSDSLIDRFFTLDPSSKYYYIVKEIGVFDDRIPKKTLPIACDPFGNLILLDLEAKSVGAIYFWDHENENMEGDPWWDNISFIAPSFTEFIENLH